MHSQAFVIMFFKMGDIQKNEKIKPIPIYSVPPTCYWLKKYNGPSVLEELVGLSLILFSSLSLEVTTTMLFVLILSLVFVVLSDICIPKKNVQFCMFLTCI